MSEVRNYVTDFRIPAEIEAQLREVAQQQGRDLNDYILAAALEKASREAKRAEQLAGLEEMTRINEKRGLYEWKLDDDTSAS